MDDFHRLTAQPLKMYWPETNLSNIFNRLETICWGPWMAASSQYSLACWSIFLKTLTTMLTILLIIETKTKKIYWVLQVRYLKLCGPQCYMDLNLFCIYLKISSFWYIPWFSWNYVDFFSIPRYYVYGFQFSAQK